MKRQTHMVVAIAVLFMLSGCSNRSPSHSDNKPPTPSIQSLASTNQKIQSILTEYGWNESGDAASVWTTKLPESYELQPGQVPIGLYWTYHNVMSKSVGLDITPYLGQTVKVMAIPLKENWKIGPPEESSDAIVITHKGKVIGIWISKGQEGHIVDICESLNHKEFGNITGLTWGNWIAQQKLVDYNDPFYAQMHQWTPRQLFQAYFSAVNNHQYGSAYAMMSSFAQYQLMIMNVPIGHLYGTAWDGMPSEGLSNWVRVKFLGIKSYRTIPLGPYSTSAEFRLYDDQNEAMKNYTVSFDATFRTPGPLNNGGNMYFASVVKESATSPWTIGGFGTGP